MCTAETPRAYLGFIVTANFLPMHVHVPQVDKEASKKHTICYNTM